MKINCWLMLGVMVATSATAQTSTNSLPPIPPPAIAPPGTTLAPVLVETNAPVKKATVKHKKHLAAAPKKIAFTEPAVTLVPGPAEVAVSNLNVRGQAGLKGEFITHINKGDAVTVISQINLDKHKADEPAQWAKIALPASVNVWVNSKFIDETNKTVLPKKLNLRAGPSEDYSVLGVLERGTVITETGAKGDWTKIEAPTNAYAYVAAMYLQQEASGNVPTNLPPSTETQTVSDTNSVPAAPDTNSIPTTAMTVAEPQPIVSEEPTNAPAVAETNSVPAPDTNASAVADTNALATVDTNLPPPPPRVVTHEGFVRHVTSLIEPTAYELYDPKTSTDINYLYTTSTNLDISRYNGLHIIVTGEEGLAERWPNTPVLTIQRIQVVE